MPRIFDACLAGLLGRLGELDAAALAAAAGMDLGLDDAAAAEFLADPGRLVRIVGDPPLGRGDPVPAQDLLGLILMDLQDNLLRDVSPRDVVRETDGRRKPRPEQGTAGPGHRGTTWAGDRSGATREGRASPGYDPLGEGIAMEKRRIGSLDVSVVGLGCNNFGWRLDAAGTKKVVDAALDAGINFFDTADIYGKGQSEEYLGRALGSRRSEIVLATKFGMKMDEQRKGAKPDYLRQALEDSLARLGTDHVDLYQLHTPDADVPIADTLGALDELVKAGKVREIGCSNFSAEQLREAEAAVQPGAARFVSVQNEYSLFHREPERDVLAACERLGLAFIPYFPLASGLLTGKYRKGRPLPEGTRLTAGAVTRPPLGREPRQGREAHRLRGVPRPHPPRARLLLAPRAPRRRLGHRRGDLARAGHEQRTGGRVAADGGGDGRDRPDRAGVGPHPRPLSHELGEGCRLPKKIPAVFRTG